MIAVPFMVAGKIYRSSRAREKLTCEPRFFTCGIRRKCRNSVQYRVRIHIAARRITTRRTEVEH